MPTPEHITGLVLAGGRGVRMGHEKGLMPFHHQTLAAHALERLQPQVHALALNANRELPAYHALTQVFHAQVWSDADPNHAHGPLAGWLSGLTHCSTEWLLCVPCDVPFFPTDLAQRLCHALEQHPSRLASVMSATTPSTPPEAQPVFCLMHCSLRSDLERFVQTGQRTVRAWIQRHQPCEVIFSSPPYPVYSFANANTHQELQALQQLQEPHAPHRGT